MRFSSCSLELIFDFNGERGRNEHSRIKTFWAWVVQFFHKSGELSKPINKSERNSADAVCEIYSQRRMSLLKFFNGK